MKFIPQALADPESRAILHVWHDEESFRRHWADKVKTIDAPGVPVHPRFIKAGDVIDWYITGWTKSEVLAVDFVPNGDDMPDWHRSGHLRFTCGIGFVNVQVDGRKSLGAPIFVFPPDEPPKACPCP